MSSDGLVAPDDITPAATPAGSQLPRLLRAVGGALLITAAATFMVHHWRPGNDMVRYGWLLALTLAVCAAGWYSGLRLQDGRGARTLLGLVLAIMPVHFAVLGGLVYSQLALEAQPLNPGRALWEAPSLLSAALAPIVGAALLWPMCWMSMRVFVQAQGTRLAAAFMLLNAALLVPVREPSLVALLLALLTPLTLLLQQRVFVGPGGLSTLEGRVARALLAVPLLLVAARTFYLYELTTSFVGTVLLATSVTMFSWTPHAPASLTARSTAQTLSGFLAAPGCLLLSDTFVRAFGVGGAPKVLAFGVPLAAAWMAMSSWALAPAGLRRGAALVLSATGFVMLGTEPTTLSAMLCILLGIMVLGYGVQVRQLAVAGAGMLTLAVGLLRELRSLIDVEALTHWATLSALGIALVVSAAQIERRAAAWRLQAKRIHTQLGDWTV